MRRPELAIVIAVVAVSFSSIFIRWGYDENLQPLAIAFYRLLFTTLLLLPFALMKQRTELRNIGGKRLAALIGIGLVLSFHFSLWVTSLELTTVASSVILVTAHPLFVGSISHFIMKDRLTKFNFAGIFVAIFGIVVLTYSDFEGIVSLSGTSALGDILAFSAGICAGVYILGGRKMRREMPLITYAFLVYLFCTLFLLFGCLLTSTPLAPLSNEALILLVLMALIPGILGHTLYNWSLKHVTATVVSVSLLGEPIGSSLLALLLLGEELTAYVLLGGSFVLAGILMTSMKVKKRRKRKKRRAQKNL
jgi:drug/metabolite transporter (DMT)-like permease